MGLNLVERLTDCVDQIEELSRRIVMIRNGNMKHQVQFGDGPWEDSTQFVVSHYEKLLGTYKELAQDLRDRLDRGES